jgi:uncharacterized protein
MLSCAAMLVVASPLLPQMAGWWPEITLGTAAALGAFVLTLLFVRWEGLRLHNVGAAPNRQSILRLVVGFGIGLFLVTLTATVLFSAGYVRWVRSPHANFASMAGPFITYLILSCREELAFHGYPLRNVERAYGMWRAQIFVALVFALEHRAGGYPWTQALLGAGVGSLLFGMAAIATGGLAVPIGLHAGWNFGQWMIGEKETSGILQEIVNDAHDENIRFARTFSYLVVMGSATFTFWLWDRRKSVRRNHA